MQSTENERWLPVVGFEGIYEVSDHGRVKSLKRVVTMRNGRTRTVAERIRKLNRLQSGHLSLPLSRGGATQYCYVHRLVLEAFVGPCPDGMECCHYDDNPANNRLENLRWDTKSANHLDKVRNGNHNMARKTHCPRGHILADPNLIPSAKPWRVCVACGRTHDFCRGRSIPFDSAIADDYYRQIMTAA